MLLDCVDLAVVALQRVWEEGGAGAGTGGGCPLELLPMEFAELDEARWVADLAACASWRATKGREGGGGRGGRRQRREERVERQVGWDKLGGNTMDPQFYVRT